MANQKITTYPTAAPDVPDNTTDFNNLSPRIHWFPNSKVIVPGSFTASHGDKFYFGSDNAFGPGTAPNDANGGIWSTNSNDGWKMTMNVGSANIPVLNGAPSGPAVGDMWFNTGDNGLYIRRS